MDLQDQAQAVAALQRSKTYNELAALRAELKQMQDREAAAPKCPYCFGPIVHPAVKCRHCASNIEWWVFEGETGPAKEGCAKNIEERMRVEMQVEIDERKRRERKSAEAFQTRLSEFDKRYSSFCKKCKKPHKIETEKDLSKADFNKGLCNACSAIKDRITLYIFLGIVVGLLIILTLST